MSTSLSQSDIDALLSMMRADSLPVLPPEQAGRLTLQGFLIPVDDHMFSVASCCTVVNGRMISFCLAGAAHRLMAEMLMAGPKSQSSDVDGAT